MSSTSANHPFLTPQLIALVSALVLAAAQPARGQERLMKPAVRPSFTGLTVTPTGPTFIDAASDMPTNIRVMWTVVPNATGYRIFRWSTAEPKRSYDADLTKFDTTAQPGYVIWNDKFVAMDPTYSYQIQGIISAPTGNQTLTTISATASAKSVPYLAPANLYLVASPSTVKNQVRLTLTWDAVPKAAYYRLTGTEKGPRGSYIVPPKDIVMPADVVLFDGDPTARRPPSGYWFQYPIVPGSTYTFCMVTYYHDSVHDDTVTKCATITP